MIAKEKKYLEIVKPARFGTGLYMTIAIVNPEYLFGNALVNINDLIDKLKVYQRLIDECCNVSN